jgi:hypothetical protein
LAYEGEESEDRTCQKIFAYYLNKQGQEVSRIRAMESEIDVIKETGIIPRAREIIKSRLYEKLQAQEDPADKKDRKNGKEKSNDTESQPYNGIGSPALALWFSNLATGRPFYKDFHRLCPGKDELRYLCYPDMKEVLVPMLETLPADDPRSLLVAVIQESMQARNKKIAVDMQRMKGLPEGQPFSPVNQNEFYERCNKAREEAHRVLKNARNQVQTFSAIMSIIPPTGVKSIQQNLSAFLNACCKTLDWQEIKDVCLAGIVGYSGKAKDTKDTKDTSENLD